MRAGLELARFARQEEEDGLSGVFGKMSVAEAAAANAVDPAAVPVDDPGEGVGGAGVDITGEEVAVIRARLVIRGGVARIDVL